jgi:hypothetical protein
MSRRVKEWAKRARARLMLALGNKCAWCGAVECLTFDCIIPTGGEHHRMSTDQRMCYYNKQARARNLQILCSACNTKKSAGENPPYIPTPLRRHTHLSVSSNFLLF